MSNEDWEETDCWEHEEQQEEILVVNDTIVEDHPRNSTPSKRRRVEERDIRQMPDISLNLDISNNFNHLRFEHDIIVS